MERRRLLYLFKRFLEEEGQSVPCGMEKLGDEYKVVLLDFYLISWEIG